MSLYNGPARGGNRGGKDQFNWDAVKNDKDRDYYLGHSVKAATGRWQKGKDILWYTRQKGSDEAAQRQEELAAIKLREEELMAEAMGIKPKSRPLAKPKLDATEMEALMRKARGEDDEEAAQPAGEDADHMPGLGFTAGDDTLTGGGGDGHEVLAGTRVAPRPGGPVAAGAAAGGPPAAPRLTPDQQAALAAAEKRAAKATRRAEKEAKSLAKAVRKEEKKAAKRKWQDGQEANGESKSRSEHSRSQRHHRSVSPDARHHKKHHRHEDRR